MDTHLFRQTAEGISADENMKNNMHLGAVRYDLPLIVVYGFYYIGYNHLRRGAVCEVHSCLIESSREHLIASDIGNLFRMRHRIFLIR